MLGIIIVILLIYFLIQASNNPKDIIPILALYTASAFKIIPSILKIFSSFQNFNYLNPSLDIIASQLKDYNNLMNTKIKQNKNLKQIHFNKKLKLKIYSLNTLKNVTEDLNIVINKNDFIGIKGDSGSGKSTLLNIISGLTVPIEGEILVDGVSIFKNLDDWRNKLGYVSQSVFLIDASIKKNIAFGIEDSEINSDKLYNAIINAGLKEYIESLKDKENTIVGERGVKISGGQKQRIGLARALYFSQELLILDEATYSLD